MIVLKVDKNTCLCLFTQKEDSGEGWPIYYEDRSSSTDFASIKAKQRTSRIDIKGHSYFYEYIEINWEMISKYYKNRIPDLSTKNLHFTGKNQLNEKHLK